MPDPNRVVEQNVKSKVRSRAALSLSLPAVFLALALGACGATEGERGNPFAFEDGEATDYAAYVTGSFAESINDPRAADYLLEAARMHPENHVLVRRAFIALLSEGRIDEAVTAAHRLDQMGHSFGLAATVLALDSFRKRHYSAARDHLAEFSGSGFEMLIGPILTAWSHAAEGNEIAALAALSPMGAAPSLRPFAAAHRAFLLDYLGNDEEAEAAYRDALGGAQISSLQPVVSYAALLQRTDRAADALALLDRYLKAMPGNGYLADARDDIAAGRKIRQAAASPEGAISLLLFRVATELERDEATRPAIVYARLATWISPGLEDARLRLAGMLTGAERYRSALAVLDGIGKKDSSYDLARLQAAYVHQRAGETAQAVSILRDLLAVRPEHVRAWSSLGDIYRSEERWPEAIEAYGRAINLHTAASDVSKAFLYFMRGVAYERAGDFDRAEADLKASLALEPNSATVLNYLGYSWIDRGEHLEEATAMIEQAVSLSPDDGFIIDSLGWAYYLRGDYPQAVLYLERAVALEPNDPTLNDHLGDAYWKVGRRTEARFQWSHALAAGPDEKQAALIRDKLSFGLELAQAEGDVDADAGHEMQ